MRTISQAVEEIIQRTPFLAETMAEGIANNAQIARRIRPDVEKRLYEKVSEAAIAMALPRVLETLSKSASKRKDTFLNFSRGLHESLIIVSSEFESEVTAALASEKHTKKIGNPSAITMRMPEESLRVPGMYYPILKSLATESISFVEIMSVRTELSIIFDNDDIDRAFSVLKRITS